MCGINNKKVEGEVFYFVFFCFNYTIYMHFSGILL